jgi:hypothetical protein
MLPSVPPSTHVAEARPLQASHSKIAIDKLMSICISRCVLTQSTVVVTILDTLTGSVRPIMYLYAIRYVLAMIALSTKDLLFVQFIVEFETCSLLLQPLLAPHSPKHGLQSSSWLILVAVEGRHSRSSTTLDMYAVNLVVSRRGDNSRCKMVECRERMLTYRMSWRIAFEIVA